MVERFFRNITVARLRNGGFRSVAELTQAIGVYIVHHNQNPNPFICTAQAKDILEKVICANRRLGSKKNATLVAPFAPLWPMLARLCEIQYCYS